MDKKQAGGDRKRKIVIKKLKPRRDRISRTRRGRKRVKVMSDPLHERLGLVPAGQWQSK